MASFGHRGPSDWWAAARFRFENLLTVSVAASLLAFLTVALSHFAIRPGAVWAGSGAALGLFCLTFLTQTFRRSRKIDIRPLSRPTAYVWMAGMAGTALAQLGNIALAGEARGGGSYLAGILVLLAIAGLQFILLALSSVSSDR